MFTKWFNKHSWTMSVFVFAFNIGGLMPWAWITVVPVLAYYLTVFLMWFVPRLRLGIKMYKRP